LKAGNPLQTLIHSNSLNKVFQDGWKGDYLCIDCEQRFSRLEDWFCKQVYDPFLSGSQLKLKYGKQLGLFAASLAFRYIRYATDINPSKPVPPALASLYENLRSSLFANCLTSITARSYIQFLFPVTSIESFPPGINTYFIEAIDAKLFTYVLSPSTEFWLVYMKLQGVFFILSACDLRQVFVKPNVLKGHEILDSGILESNSQTGALSPLVGDIFNKRAIEIQTNYSQLPAERLNKIRQKIADTKNKQQYRAHQTYLLDMKLLTDFQAKHSEQANRPKP
jgi:hypothetical protein